MLYPAVLTGVAFGDAVRAHRESLGWTQNELARRAGLNQPTLQRIESGKSADPSVSIALSIAKALGVSLESLWGAATRPAPAASESDLAETVARLTARVEDNRKELWEAVQRQTIGIEQIVLLRERVEALEEKVSKQPARRKAV